MKTPGGETEKSRESDPGIVIEREIRTYAKYCKIEVSYLEKNGERKARNVYQMRELDPELVLPPGIQYSNGRRAVLKEHSGPITNRKLMEEGKAPFAALRDAEGNVIGYQQIEIHHMLGVELARKSGHLEWNMKDGAVMEIPEYMHRDKKIKGIIHISLEKGISFRREKILKRAEDGSLKRVWRKTYEYKHYEQFRADYWKFRAESFRNGEKTI